MKPVQYSTDCLQTSLQTTEALLLNRGMSCMFGFGVEFAGGDNNS